MNDGGEKNIDGYLDDRIKNTYYSEVTDSFTPELMRQIELEKEFAKEDFRTSRIAKFIVSGCIAMLAAISILFAFLISSNEDSKDAGLFDSVVERFSSAVENLSIMISDNLGFTFDSQTALIIILAMACVLLFSFADKIIFKKSYK